MLFRKVRKTATDEMNDLDREYGERLQKGLAGLAGAVYGAEPREILERVLRKACVWSRRKRKPRAGAKHLCLNG